MNCNAFSSKPSACPCPCGLKVVGWEKGEIGCEVVGKLSLPRARAGRVNKSSQHTNKLRKLKSRIFVGIVVFKVGTVTRNDGILTS